MAVLSRLDPERSCAQVGSSLAGLTADEAQQRLKACGPNLVARENKPSILQEIWGRCRNPLNALLLTLASVSYFLGDVRAAIVIALMVLLAVGTAFVQEHRSNEAAARLRAMVKTTASVTAARERRASGDFAEVPIETLVPGDIVRLSAGDMIPADLRLLEAKDLFINQSALTGEAMPVEKFAHACAGSTAEPVRSPQHLLHGRATSSAASAPALSCAPAARTFFGQLADEIAGPARAYRASTRASTGSPG